MIGNAPAYIMIVHHVAPIVELFFVNVAAALQFIGLCYTFLNCIMEKLEGKLDVRK